MPESRQVLVTGAGSGLGKSIAEGLARGGWRAVGTVRDPARAAELTDRARQVGLGLRYLPLELGSAEAIEAAAREVERDGGVDALVHNAGFGVFGPVEEVDAEAVARQFEVNLFGPLRLTRRLLPGLRARRGRIVFVGSLAGRFALPFQAHYSASKAALAAVSDALRLELAPFGVRVSLVEPGDFATGFTDARHTRALDGSPYRARMQACLEAVDAQERGGDSPEGVAAVVAELLACARPPARRPVGRWARTLALLQRLLPDRLREEIVRRMYRV